MQALQRDTKEKDQMIFKQTEQGQKLQNRVDHLQDFQQSKGQNLSSDIKQFQDIENHKRDLFELRKNKSQHEPKQHPTMER